MYKRLISLCFVFLALLVIAANPMPVLAAPTANQEAGGCRITASGATVKKVQGKVGVAQDGKLGPITCNAIKKYQCTKNLNVDGNVGPITWGIMRGNTPPRGMRICADLKHQTLWLSENGVRTYTAERMRSGLPATPTKTGNHTIGRKYPSYTNSDGASMPYSMFFYQGQAIHESTFTRNGSNGCLNVTRNDARKLFSKAHIGTPVSVWGAR